MNQPDAVHRYRVRVPQDIGGAGDPLAVELQATVDVAAETVTFAMADQPATTVDVVTARALSMLLWQAVFGSLRPSGPRLDVQKNTGHGWQAPA